MKNVYTVDIVENNTILAQKYFTSLESIKNWIKAFCKVSVFVWKNGDFYTSYNLWGGAQHDKIFFWYK